MGNFERKVIRKICFIFLYTQLQIQIKYKYIYCDLEEMGTLESKNIYLEFKNHAICMKCFPDGPCAIFLNNSPKYKIFHVLFLFSMSIGMLAEKQ